ncbi:uncharacterized protein LOC105438728 [Strongylocentrotus purpuratus]|uniref:Uncharacterized protein n=1 Tax=Strongylocentrotus purpuratus TaxID=7668 RepID=A0A7M7P640_STRPU|nr:uncharacterized protein LOC105438728 [Strongylocentrotus purpuratus]XP_030846699.1 uncharacterized protein LOC105438728 [Strongylocentrotus purpuratus]
MFPNQKAVRSKDLNQRRALSQNVGQSLRSVHHTPSNRQGDGETYFRPTIAAASRSSRKEAAPKTSTAPSSQPPPEDQKKNTTLNQHQRIGKHAGREDNRKEYLRPRQNQASHNTSTNVTSTSPPPYSDEPSTESRTNVRYGPILPPTPDKTAKRRWSVCDDMDGEQLDSIAKGMMSNVRLPKQKKGVKIAGRRIGKAKRKRRKRKMTLKLVRVNADLRQRSCLRRLNLVTHRVSRTEMVKLHLTCLRRSIKVIIKRRSGAEDVDSALSPNRLRRGRFVGMRSCTN